MFYGSVAAKSLGASELAQMLDLVAAIEGTFHGRTDVDYSQSVRGLYKRLQLW